MEELRSSGTRGPELMEKVPARAAVAAQLELTWRELYLCDSVSSGIISCCAGVRSDASLLALQEGGRREALGHSGRVDRREI